jgi:hypothetical protein
LCSYGLARVIEAIPFRSHQAIKPQFRNSDPLSKLPGNRRSFDYPAVFPMPGLGLFGLVGRVAALVFAA